MDVDDKGRTLEAAGCGTANTGDDAGQCFQGARADEDLNWELDAQLQAMEGHPAQLDALATPRDSLTPWPLCALD